MARRQSIKIIGSVAGELLVKDCLVNFVSIPPRRNNFEALRDYDGVSLEGGGAENSSDKSNMWLALSCCQERSFDWCSVNWSGLCTVKANHMFLRRLLRYLG